MSKIKTELPNGYFLNRKNPIQIQKQIKIQIYKYIYVHLYLKNFFKIVNKHIDTTNLRVIIMSTTQ